jgi:hypothetical protein
MSPYDDDEDWTGTPPEGRYTRDRANPGFWAQNWPALRWVFGLLGLAIVVVVVLAVV